jgi:putative ATPase
MPEGLYALAEAALYLAGTEKSNSSLGFFDALKTVRAANRQQVPSHLRDAHRDGAAFGDGVGYRYPHAYAEHWVAQQYLPSALQGEVFWQPGELGWEGSLRTRLQQRRAAQLAAAAETAADQPDLLSGGPRDPGLDRWLQRQAAAEGERLDRLRRRFWQDAVIGRLDRVLVLDGRSLLWALDPLEAAAEGEVVITVPDAGVEARLRGELEVLDRLRRPRILAVTAEQPDALAAQLEAGWQFEWLAARQPFPGLSSRAWGKWLGPLTALAGPRAELRWLISRPLLSPCAGLLRTVAGRGGENDLLARVLPLEKTWLRPCGADVDALREALAALGWGVISSSWEEQLELPLREHLIQRWFAPGANYRRRLEQHLETTALEQLIQRFRQNLDVVLPQPVEHTLLQAERRPTKKTPRRRRGD